MNRRAKRNKHRNKPALEKRVAELERIVKMLGSFSPSTCLTANNQGLNGQYMGANGGFLNGNAGYFRL